MKQIDLKKKIEKILLKAQIDPTSVTYWDGCVPELVELFNTWKPTPTECKCDCHKITWNNGGFKGTDKHCRMCQPTEKPDILPFQKKLIKKYAGRPLIATEKPMEEINLEHIQEAVARGWCYKANEDKCMDSDLALAISNEVYILLAEYKQKLIKRIEGMKVDVRPEITEWLTHNNRQEAVTYNNCLDEVEAVIREDK